MTEGVGAYNETPIDFNSPFSFTGIIGFWLIDDAKTAFEYYYTGGSLDILSVDLIPYGGGSSSPFNKVYAFLPWGTDIVNITILGIDIPITKVRPLRDIIINPPNYEDMNSGGSE